jgi:CheY-like chemotaxis protein
MSKKILLADDSITIQKVVELTFSDGDYEVTAVNNGARAIQKLSEMRPDIILSDIIMPEKNGYEVCEFVKSHPDYRNIPVVLLTGTFEPFDPDRADKAGCDAVVTKPFESQSLIHKVEELIESSRSAAPASAASAPQAIAPAPAPAPAFTPAPAPTPAPAASQPSPWEEETPAPPSSPSGPAPGFRHANDIFGAPAEAPKPTSEMPFAAPPAGGETRAIPALNFDAPGSSATTQQMTPPVDEPPSPWDTPSPMGGETRAFPKMSFDDMKKLAEEKAPPADAFGDQIDDSPFGAPPAAEQFSGETRAFPKMNFDDLQKMAAERAPEPEKPSTPAAEESPWGAAPAMGETRAFPQMNFEQLSKAAEESGKASSDASPWEEPAETSAPAWSSTPEPPSEAPTPFSAPPAAFEVTPEPAMPEPEAPAWETPASAPAAASTGSGNGVDLTEDQIDRIARRVIQLMSDQVVRNIAWEVIPDMAEMVVKERIRQLESEG